MVAIDLKNIFLFLPVGVSAAVIPGPSIALVLGGDLATKANENRGLITGLVFGSFIYVLCAIAGLGYLIAKHNSILSMVEIFGSVLLIGLGLVKLCWLKNNAQWLKSTESGKKSKDFIAGVLTTLSNPKIAL